jgi:hypothetical protein
MKGLILVMNKELLDNFEVTLAEGHGFAIGKLYNNMYEYKSLCKKIKAVQIQLESVIGVEYLKTFKQFMQANDNKTHFEQRFMYIQGMKDYHDILQYLNDGALEKYLLDYDFKYNTDEE